MIGEEILKSVQIIVDKAMSEKNYDLIGGITAVSGDKCTVQIQNQPYKIKNGTGVTFKPGDRCLVHCINGNFQHKVIIAKL